MLRADDAASARPVCGDHLAERFLTPEIRADMAPLVAVPGPAASNVARHRIIDEIVHERLSRDAALRVILLGAGFDTRAFRMTGGRWWEIDDAPLLTLKDEKLPAASAPNPLVRIPVDFSRETVAAPLARLAGDDHALAIMEGVSMYLDDESLAATAHALRAALPRATLVCDIMTPKFKRRFGGELRKLLREMGAHVSEGSRDPRELIEAAGYRAARRIPIVARAHAEGTIGIPGWILDLFLRELRDGYAVHVFEPSRA